MHRLVAFAGLAATSLAIPSAMAQSMALTPAKQAELAARVPGAKPGDVHVSPIPGLYEISTGAFVGYISADGRFLVSGDIYEIDARENLTEARRSQARLRTLATVDERDMIIFSPEQPKHTITVFTDVDCGYCRKLHSEMAELNRLGIRVRYLAYPRSGPGSPSWATMEAVWCAKDRQEAITKAKSGGDVGPATCGATPVARQYELGEEVGVRGTPAIITDSGDYLGGYMPARQLAAYLDQHRRASVVR